MTELRNEIEMLKHEFLTPFPDIVKMVYEKGSSMLGIEKGVICFYRNFLSAKLIIHEIGHILTVDCQRWYRVDDVICLNYQFKIPTTTDGLICALKHELAARAIEVMMCPYLHLNSYNNPVHHVEMFIDAFAGGIPELKLPPEQRYELIIWFKQHCYDIETIRQMWKDKMDELRLERDRIKAEAWNDFLSADFMKEPIS